MQEAFSPLNITLNFYETTKNITSPALTVIVWLTISGEGKNGVELPPFVHNLPNIGLVESKL